MKMEGIEYEDRVFWEKKWIAEEEIEKKALQEESRTEGNDGENYLDRTVGCELRIDLVQKSLDYTFSVGMAPLRCSRIQG